jgi:hypothetical protein
MKHLLLLAGLAMGVLVIQADPTVRGGKKVDTRVFEMRTYYAHPGKMQALHARFRDHTLKLFVKHGMTNIGYWSPIDAAQAEKKLVYILAFPSQEAAKKSWEAFKNDPDWIKAKNASEKDGALVAKVESVFLKPTDYSPMK